MGKVMDYILNKVENTNTFPVFINSNECPIIQESSLVCQFLEDKGFTVDTYADDENSVYGLRISRDSED